MSSSRKKNVTKKPDPSPNIEKKKKRLKEEESSNEETTDSSSQEQSSVSSDSSESSSIEETSSNEESSRESSAYDSTDGSSDDSYDSDEQSSDDDDSSDKSDKESSDEDDTGSSDDDDDEYSDEDDTGSSDDDEESSEADDDEDYISSVPAADRRSFERFDRMEPEEKKKQSWRQKRREKKLKKLKAKRPSVPFHTMSVKEVEKHFNTSAENGLSSEDAAERLVTDGTNELKDDGGVNPFKLLLSHLINGMNLILFVAMVVSFATQQWVEAVVIVILIFSNTLIGFFQEFRSEQALASLRKLSAPVAQVVRDGAIKRIATNEVVKGDVVVFEMGDFICADLRLCDVNNLAVDEALLTGESLPVDKITTKLDRLDEPVGDRINLAYMSTIVSKGKGKGIVIHCGMETEIGNIAKKLKQTSRSKRSPLNKLLDIIAYGLFGIAIILGVIVLGVNEWEVDDKTYPLYAISIGICIIPEGLPAVLSMTLTVGVKTMTKQRAIVRRITALETLGAVTNICSDKTGTLTLAKMFASRIWTPDSKYYTVTGQGFNLEGDIIDDETEKTLKDYPFPLETLLYCSSLCNMASVGAEAEKAEEGDDVEVDMESGEEVAAIGDPTEIALQVLAHKVGLGKPALLEKDYTIECEHQFDSSIKRMSVVVKHKGEYIGYLKGAPERVLDCCTKYLDSNGKLQSTTDEFYEMFKDVNNDLASDGLRVLAIAYRPDMSKKDFTPRETTESEFIFIGFVGIYDPPREESKTAVETCHRAGIMVHMATGDHQSTARAIAQQVSILPENYSESMVMTAKEFDDMTDEEIDNLETIPLVLARCSPDSKVKLIAALHRRNRLVAMTGDGVNDAPALNSSDIGVSMGKTGSDVAKQSSDIILTDDNFATIVSAVSTGRRTLDNITKILSHLICGNVAEVVMLILGLSVMTSDPKRTVFPLSPLQALWINMIGSSPPAIGLGYEKAGKNEMKKAPKSAKKRIVSSELVFDIIYYGFVLGCIGLSVFLYTLYVLEDGELGYRCNKLTSESENCDSVFKARAVGFISVALSLYLHAFNCKDKRKPIWKINVLDNRMLIYTTLFSTCVTIPMVYIPFLNDKVFVMAPMNGYHWITAFVAVMLFFVFGEAYKFFKRLCLKDPATQVLTSAELMAVRK